MAELQRESLHTSLESTKKGKEREELNFTIILVILLFVRLFVRSSIGHNLLGQSFVRSYVRPSICHYSPVRSFVTSSARPSIGRPSATTLLVDRLFVCLFFWPSTGHF